MEKTGKQGKAILKFGFFIIFINYSAFCESQVAFKSIQDAHKTVFDLLTGGKYTKDIRPYPARPDSVHGNATVIKVNIALRKINRIDDLRMEISTQMTFRQLWIDHRLEYNNTNLEYVTLNEEMAEKIWSPHLFFSNEASSFVHKTMKTNTFKRVYPDGRVVWSTRLTIVSNCPMDFKYFPFESQICSLSISEYSNIRKHISVIWDEDTPVLMLEPKKLRYSRFTLEKIQPEACAEKTVAKVGEFSCIFVNFHFQRQSSVYILNLYLPSTMCVMLSWISFWLGPSISARLSLTLTLLLTMTTQIQGANQNLPQVSYTKALDMWTGFLTTLGALAILQTATVAFCLQHDKTVELGSIFVNTKNKNEQNRKFGVYTALARKIDIISRLLFPLCFALFVVVYVLVYVIWQTSTNYTDHLDD